MNICFYSCFFGKNDYVSNKINPPPSNEYDFFYYTNNYSTFEQLKNTNWKRRFVPVPVKKNSNINCFDSKLLKSCPHLIEELNKYEYSVYIDTCSMLNVTVDELINTIQQRIQQNPECVIMMLPHRFWPKAENAIAVEYHKSMEQSRYLREQDQVISYINQKLQIGYSLNIPMHFETGFIVRKQQHPVTVTINNTWYNEICECGIECQISFGFVQQMFPNNILPFNEPLDSFIVVQEGYKNKNINRIEKDGFIFWNF